MYVDLRKGYPYTFGNDLAREQFERDCDAMREKMKSRYCVGPGSRIVTTRGVLSPGAPVEPSDLYDEVTSGRVVKSAEQRFRDLLERRSILESEAHAEGAA